MTTNKNHSATVSMFLHINDGQSFKLGKVGPGIVHLHQDEKKADYGREDRRLAILEIIVDGKPNRKAVLIRQYLKGNQISICSDI